MKEKVYHMIYSKDLDLIDRPCDTDTTIGGCLMIYSTDKYLNLQYGPRYYYKAYHFFLNRGISISEAL
jgi:hypothetical protein